MYSVILTLTVIFLSFTLSAFSEQESAYTYGNRNASELDLFISTEEVHHPNDEMIILNDNSALAFSAPYIVTSQVLGMGGDSTRSSIVSYRVDAGDTISSVAQDFGITENTIKWANDINDNLKIGDELLILPTSGAIYYVQKGDTISTIAERHKAKSKDIMSFNNLDSESIIPGQMLIIPGGTPPPRVTSTSIIGTSFVNPVPGGKITQGIHFYNAIDIYNPCGYPVVASASGVVTEVAYGTWPAGDFIKIDHGSVVILYAHMKDIFVSSGDRVYQGQTIGTVGNTGYTIGATGCHLHFDVLSRQTANPLAHYRVGTFLK